MKISTIGLLVLVATPAVAFADETGHGNCAYVCSGATTTTETESTDQSLLDLLLDIFTLDEETASAE